MSATLDPQAAALLERIRASGRPNLNELPVLEARRQYSAFVRAVAADPPPLRQVEDMVIPGPAGDIAIRVYRPQLGAHQPYAMYFHGGGFVIGSLDTHDVPCRILARESGVTLISIDYRLAPEHKFPAAIEDALYAARHVHAHAAEFQLDSSRWLVAGDSAGGNIAAVVCQQLNLAGGPHPGGQVLFYPQTDFRFAHPSHETLSKDYRLTKELIAWFGNHYLRGDADRFDPRASPLMTSELRGLPPAWIMTAGFDPLIDEGKAYAARLTAAGVPVAYRCFETLIHGVISMTGVVDAGWTVLREAAGMLRAFVNRSPR